MSSTTSNPVLEFRRRKRTRSNISVFTLPTSLAKRPHIEEISESALPVIEVTAPSDRGASAQAQTDTETSSSSASSDAESETDSSEEASGDNSEASETPRVSQVQYPSIPRSEQDVDEDRTETDDETSSSSASSSSSDSQSRSPSPTPALPSLQNIREDPHSASAPLPLNGAGRRTYVTAPSSLSRRLKEFLPAMRSANEDLELERANGTLIAKNIENVGEDGSEEPGRYIEMNLGLGVIEGKPEDGSGSDSDDIDSQHSSEITDPMDRSDEGLLAPTGTKPGKEEDVMGKLKGEPRREKPEIEVVEEIG